MYNQCEFYTSVMDLTYNDTTYIDFIYKRANIRNVVFLSFLPHLSVEAKSLINFKDNKSL